MQHICGYSVARIINQYTGACFQRCSLRGVTLTTVRLKPIYIRRDTVRLVAVTARYSGVRHPGLGIGSDRLVELGFRVTVGMSCRVAVLVPILELM